MSQANPQNFSQFENKEDLMVPSHFSTWRKNLNEIIFGYHTFWGKFFDLVVLIAIVVSLGVIMIESVGPIRDQYGFELHEVEWGFTLLFSIEYLARVVSHPSPRKYIFSFMGIVDLLSIIPTFLSIYLDGSHSSLLAIRSIRLVRVFRILKLTRYIGGAKTMSQALWNSRHKLVVFLGYIMCIVVIVGTLLYVIEHGENGFTSIPRSIYWAIVTLTTVGYGDISPQTALGQTLASVIMIIGYAIIAVPTGIVTGEVIKAQKNTQGKKCSRCTTLSKEVDANYCFKCGEKLE